MVNLTIDFERHVRGSVLSRTRYSSRTILHGEVVLRNSSLFVRLLSHASIREQQIGTTPSFAGSASLSPLINHTS